MDIEAARYIIRKVLEDLSNAEQEMYRQEQRARVHVEGVDVLGLTGRMPMLQVSNKELEELLINCQRDLRDALAALKEPE